MDINLQITAAPCYKLTLVLGEIDICALSECLAIARPIWNNDYNKYGESGAGLVTIDTLKAALENIIPYKSLNKPTKPEGHKPNCLCCDCADV